MNLIPNIPPWGYKYSRLDSQDYEKFLNIIENTIWTIDPDGRYKMIPDWANHKMRDVSDTDSECLYEFTADKYLPEELREFGHYIIHKYCSEIGIIDKSRISVTFWNGAQDTGWHTDADGDKTGSHFVTLLYHVPEPLTLEDGGVVHFGEMIDGKIIENTIIIPQDGAILSLWVDKDKYQHKAVPIKSHKNRFSFLIGVVADGEKSTSYVMKYGKTNK